MGPEIAAACCTTPAGLRPQSPPWRPGRGRRQGRMQAQSRLPLVLVLPACAWQACIDRSILKCVWGGSEGKCPYACSEPHSGLNHCGAGTRRHTGTAAQAELPPRLLRRAQGTGSGRMAAAAAAVRAGAAPEGSCQPHLLEQVLQIAHHRCPAGGDSCHPARLPVRLSLGGRLPGLLSLHLLIAAGTAGQRSSSGQVLVLLLLRLGRPLWRNLASLVIPRSASGAAGRWCK